MRYPALLAALSLAACGQDAAPIAASTSAGTRLEAAAVAAGIVTDVTKADITGSWARDTDRMCVVRDRIGVVIDYGDGQGCSASGTLKRKRDRLSVSLGDCRFDATFDGDRIIFPAAVPAACDALCNGRASLAAMTVQRLSDSASEAATLRGRRRKLLCAP